METKITAKPKIRGLIVSILLLFFCLESCENQKKGESSNIKIKLTRSTGGEFIFQPDIIYNNFLAYTREKTSKKLYNKKLKTLKGIPKLDSFKLVSLDIQRMVKYFREYNNHKMKKKVFFDIYKDRLDDTLIISQNHDLKAQLNIISGFLGDQQLLIPDLNNNRDF